MNKNLRLKPIALLLAILLQVFVPFCGADEGFKFEFDYDSRSVLDSTRRDWYDYVYDPASSTPSFVRQQYDKTFLSSQSDMFLALRNDLSETHFVDIKETFYYRHYNESEMPGRAYSSFRYKELDHLFNLTWGIAAGDHDYVQFDYFNNVLDLPDLKSLSYKSNRGAVQMTHEFAQRTCFTLYGSFEERQYDTDFDADFRAGRAGFEIASLIPGRHKYVAVAASARGDRKYFEQFPGAMAARKAVDYYTSYAVDPRDDDPRARYEREKTRGDLFLKVFGELASNERTKIGNGVDEAAVGLSAAYEIAMDMTLKLRDTYRKTDCEKESTAYFLHDKYANYLALAIDYDYSKNMAQTITFGNEIHRHSVGSEEDYGINSLVYEGLFSFGRSRASLVLGGLWRRYEQKRLYYPDENELRACLAYDYLITDALKFRMKSEFVDSEYPEFEDFLYSTHSRNSWWVGVEKAFSRSNSLELAYQENNERHDVNLQNNIAEKTIGLSWLSRF
ncbi:MAG: hypothetical protein EOM80_07415 [Erysipelotrichia bacterium]|nr:hypothetical protein [Erysipelotrichia bacterium]